MPDGICRTMEFKWDLHGRSSNNIKWTWCSVFWALHGVTSIPDVKHKWGETVEVWYVTLYRKVLVYHTTWCHIPENCNFKKNFILMHYNSSQIIFIGYVIKKTASSEAVSVTFNKKQAKFTELIISQHLSHHCLCVINCNYKRGHVTLLKEIAVS